MILLYQHNFYQNLVNLTQIVTLMESYEFLLRLNGYDRKRR